MSLLNLFRVKRAPPAAQSETPLFDDSFQRKLETLALVSRRVFSGISRANRRSKKRGGGVEFADHRNYSPGDDFRFVDWAVYRRFGRLLLRLYEEEEDLSVYFIVDCSGSMAFGQGEKFDQARRLCAALSYVALANLDRVTVVGIGEGVAERLPAVRGKQRIFSIFRFLEGLRCNHATDLAAAMKTFAAQNKRRGLAILLSDLYDPKGFEEGLNVLRYNRFEPYVLHIVDRTDGTPEVTGDIRVEDCEDGDGLDITLTEPLRKRLATNFEDYQDRAESYCTSKQVPYLRAPVDEDFDQLVFQLFRQGGFVGR